MDRAGSQVAEYFRLAEDGMALELYSDLLAVNRDFLSMVAVLRGEFAVDSALDQNCLIFLDKIGIYPPQTLRYI